jgi:hypothetical protein
VLVADAPDSFASSIERLLVDSSLWERLSQQGSSHILARHGREIVRRRLLEIVSSVLSRPAKRAMAQGTAGKPAVMGPQSYREMIERVRQAIAETVPDEEIVAVASRGDEELLKVPGRRGWHFPQDSRGDYAGHYPRDGLVAVEQLEALRSKGAGFVVFPETALWWLDYYRELKRHLVDSYEPILERDGTCVIFDIRTARRNQPNKSVTVPISSATVVGVN